ncbi:class I SAM-dependent methyltransferase, partial [Chitinophaga sp.]|uniref:class I SAM-dependent methyltransferase n=1 Tax=Chitinophaga sp. TaxID=1869181 RepID=UPI002BCF3A64
INKVMERKDHWENIYSNKKPEEMSWTQEVPAASLALINSFNVPKNAPVIDIGGGESKLVDHLLAAGYTDITVLDISAHALEHAKARLGEQAKSVNWLVQDVTTFVPARSYAVWHDRATFHFLTTPEQIAAYLRAAGNAVNGYMAIGTFSDKGPEKCSGLTIKQYSEETLTEQLTPLFEKLHCTTEDHITPFNTRQHFLFCSFKSR